MRKCKIIAEVGANHQGSMEIAHEMIKIAANYCKCDGIKFQKRDLNLLSRIEKYNLPHPNPENSFGSTYYEHRKFLEFSLKQHSQLKEWCNEENIEYSCSAWDLQSAKDIISLNTKYIKIPSACNQNFEMLNWIIEHSDIDIHISLGMTTKKEMQKILKIFTDKRIEKRLVLYHCTSGYPIKFNEVNLLELEKLNIYKNTGICKDFGFSGHHLGTAVDLGAIMMNAGYIERHFTLDRSQKGSDHSASLEPDQLRKLVRDRNVLMEAITYKKEEIIDCEILQRKKLKLDE